eukprot:UN15499
MVDEDDEETKKRLPERRDSLSEYFESKEHSSDEEELSDLERDPWKTLSASHHGRNASGEYQSQLAALFDDGTDHSQGESSTTSNGYEEKEKFSKRIWT